MDAETGLYCTKDLDLASYLYASGVVLVELDWRDPLNVQFCFQRPDSALLVAFQTSQATANVHALNNARKYLLNRLHRRGE